MISRLSKKNNFQIIYTYLDIQANVLIHQKQIVYNYCKK